MAEPIDIAKRETADITAIVATKDPVTEAKRVAGRRRWAGRGAVLSVVSAAVSLGFALKRPDVTEGEVLTHVSTIVLGVYAIFERVWSYLEKRQAMLRKLGLVIATVGATAVGLATGPGCASAERNGDVLTFVVRDDPARPWPACLYESTLDGKPLLRGAVADCSKIPAAWKVEP